MLDGARAGKPTLTLRLRVRKTNAMSVQDGRGTTEHASCKEQDSPPVSSYDDSVAFLGQWGRFQRVVFFLLCASIVPNGFGAFTLVFLTDIPTHQCLVPDVNLTEHWRETIIPTKVSQLSQRYLTRVRTRHSQREFPTILAIT